eukprot:GAHX01003986.1.p1 GENE.GAHX01003986.1~~GAHX01003986.1.p1  ORF type:complete len:418 (+),score=47.95 GAHX01003986.1:27-1280(+)
MNSYDRRGSGSSPPRRSFNNNTNNYYRDNNLLGGTHTATQRDVQRISNSVTFTIKNGSISGPIVSLPVLKDTTNLEVVPGLIEQFKVISSANEWSNTDALTAFKLLLDSPLLKAVSHGTLDETLVALQSRFFPKTDFFVYKRRIKTIRHSDFSSIREYVDELRRLQGLANLTLHGNDQLGNRELYEAFITGLPFDMRKIASLVPHVSIDVLANKLDESLFITQQFSTSFRHQKNYSNDYRRGPPRNNYNRNFNRPTGRSNFNDQNKRQGCKYHKTLSHSTQDCRFLNNQRKPPYHNSESKNIRHPPSQLLSQVQLSIKGDNKELNALIDSGSTKCVIRRSSVPDFLVKPSLDGNPLIYGNGKVEFHDDEADLELSFPDHGTHQSFKVTAIVADNLHLSYKIGNHIRFFWLKISKFLY